MDELETKRAPNAPQAQKAVNPAFPQFLRPKEAASYFGIGVSTLWLWLKTRPGMPPAIRAGPKTTLIDVPETSAYFRRENEVKK